MKNKILYTIAFIIVSSCSFDPVKNEFRIYKQSKKNNNFTEALQSLDKVLDKTTDINLRKKALLEKANIYLNNIEDNKKLIKTYEQLSNISTTNELKIDYKILIAELYISKFDKLDKAIEVLSGFNYKNSKAQKKIHKKLAEIYYKKKDYYQAIVEVNKYLNSKITKKESFDGLVLKSDILYQFKKQNKAIENYELILKQYPFKSKVNEVYMTLLNLYESEGMIKKAIDLIQKMIEIYPEKRTYLKQKLKRFNELVKNMPGAKGLRR